MHAHTHTHTHTCPHVHTHTFYSFHCFPSVPTQFRTGYEGLLGIGGESIFVVDREAMEV